MDKSGLALLVLEIVIALDASGGAAPLAKIRIFHRVSFFLLLGEGNFDPST